MEKHLFDELKIIEIIIYTLERLYINDFILFENNVSERTIVFRFGLYFDKLLKRIIKNKNLSIDFEYNRNIKSKYMFKSIGINENRRKTYPDIIVHERKKLSNNILAIEFKKWNSYKRNDLIIINGMEKSIDDVKLRYYTSPNNEYKYKLGLAIKLGKTIGATEITIYKSGNIYIKGNYKEIKDNLELLFMRNKNEKIWLDWIYRYLSKH